MLVCALTKRGRLATRWVVGPLVLSSACFLVFGGASLPLVIREPVLPQETREPIAYSRTAIGTFGAGVLVTLFMSGQWTKPPPAKT